MEIVQAVERVNLRQKRLLGAKIRRHFDDRLTGRAVAIWGLAFKPQTDDIRESPAITLLEDLLEAGATVRAHDPQAMENIRALFGNRVTLCETMYDAVVDADALAVVTEWHEYRRPDFQRIKRLMRNASLFDGRNIWDPDEIRSFGFWYTGIGRS